MPTVAGFRGRRDRRWSGLLFATRFGIAITAVHDDERVADLMGLDVRAFQVAAFTLGSVIAGIGGGLYAHHFSYIEAQYFSISLSRSSIVLYVLFGGTQSVLGPLLGAAVFTLLPELLRGSAHWRYVLFAAIVIVVMVVRPQGLVTGGADPAPARHAGRRRAQGAAPHERRPDPRARQRQQALRRPARGRGSELLGAARLAAPG